VIEFEYLNLADASSAEGVAIVIDVLRAFTTAAFAFSSGAERIIPVSGINEAQALNQKLSGSILMGEDHGMRLQGFNFGNSPDEIARKDLTGKTVIQRTSAGTQGIVRASRSCHIVAASFVVAKATARYISWLKPKKITFIITGESFDRDGDEDRACAEYIEALLCNVSPDPDLYRRRVLSSSAGQSFARGCNHYLTQEDIKLSMLVDHFGFCMPVVCEENLLVMYKHDFFDQNNFASLKYV